MFNSSYINAAAKKYITNIDGRFLDAKDEVTAKFLSCVLGLKEGFLKQYNSWLSIDDELYYYKSFEFINELFLSELAQEFKVNAIKYRLASSSGEYGIISKSFKNKDKRYYDYDKYFQHKGMEEPRSIIYLDRSLRKLLPDAERVKFMNDIFRLTAFDFFCGQTDRGDTNLMIEEGKETKLAPIFDNGMALFFPRSGKKHVDVLFTNYYSSFDNLYFPSDDDINMDNLYLFDLINNNVEFYNALCTSLNIDINKVLNRTISKYHLAVPKCDRQSLIDFFDIKKRIIDNTLTLAKRYK